MPESVEAGAGRPEGQRVVLSSRTRKGGEAGRRGRRGPRDPASEQKLFVLRNRQLSGSRDGGGSRAAVAAQLAGKPGWDKGRAGRGWHGAAAFAAEDGTGVLGPLSEWRPEPGAREARELWRDWGWSQRARSSAWCRTGGTGDRCGGGVVAWGVREWVPPGKSGDSGTDAETARSSEPREWRHRSCSRWPCFRLCTQIPERPEPPSLSASQGCPITRGGGCIPQGDSGRGGLPRWLRGGRRLES